MLKAIGQKQYIYQQDIELKTRLTDDFNAVALTFS